VTHVYNIRRTTGVQRVWYALLISHSVPFTKLTTSPQFVSIKDRGNIRAVLKSWPRPKDARIAVVTDGSRILGLGDLGVNGMPISIGKLSLYVAGAGVRPSSTIPICLDLGTNTQKFLDDPLYLGLRQRRPSDEEMSEFMEEFMREMHREFPHLLVQFEDFATAPAFKYLEAFRNRPNVNPVFNDDIQACEIPICHSVYC
jgi:malate dehydrogenase (oxaloacetate-decarboxylating)(NADP+)